jgi:hypothetical protein
MDKVILNNGRAYPNWVLNQYENQQQQQSSNSSTTSSSSSNQRFIKSSKIRQRQSPLLPPQSPTPFNSNVNSSARTSAATTPYVSPNSSRRNSQQSLLHFHKCDNSSCLERTNHAESCSSNHENANVKRIIYVQPANDSHQKRSTSKPIERKIVSANGRMRASSVSEDKYYNYYRSANSPLAYIETIAIKKEGVGNRGGVIIRRPKNEFYYDSRSARSTPGRNLSSRDELVDREIYDSSNRLDRMSLNDEIIKKFTDSNKSVNVYRFSNDDNYSKSSRSTPKSLGFKTHKSQLFATIHPNNNYFHKVHSIEIFLLFSLSLFF